MHDSRSVPWDEGNIPSQAEEVSSGDAPAVGATNPRRRSLAARIAAAERWGRCPDRTAETLPARQGLRAKYARQVDPRAPCPPTSWTDEWTPLCKPTCFGCLLLPRSRDRQRRRTRIGEANDWPAAGSPAATG